MRRVAAAALVLAAWEAIVAGLRMPPWVMPGPAATATALWNGRATIAAHLAFTLEGAMAGLAASVGVALTLAVSFVLSDSLARSTMPLLVVLRTVPVVAVAPLLVVAVGRSLWTSVTVALIVSFFPLLLNATRGLRAAPEPTLAMMHVAGASWWQKIWKVRLPYAVPHLFTGLRLAAANALLGAMLAEWLSGTPGLGFLILDAAAMQDVARLWALAGIGMLTGLTFYRSLGAVEARLDWLEHDLTAPIR